MPAAGARPKEAKINLMDCICLCSEVEIGRFHSHNLSGVQVFHGQTAWRLHSGENLN